MKKGFPPVIWVIPSADGHRIHAAASFELHDGITYIPFIAEDNTKRQLQAAIGETMNLREFIDSTRAVCEKELDGGWDGYMLFHTTARTALPLALEMLEIASRALEDIKEGTNYELGSTGLYYPNRAIEALAEMAKKLEGK